MSGSRRCADTVHHPPRPQSLLNPPVRPGALFALSGAIVSPLHASASSVSGGIPGHDGAVCPSRLLWKYIHSKTWRKIMRNLKRVWILFLSFALVLSLCTSAYAAVEDTGFSDVAADAWYTEFVVYCRNNGLMTGMKCPPKVRQYFIVKAVQATERACCL